MGSTSRLAAKSHGAHEARSASSIKRRINGRSAMISPDVSSCRRRCEWEAREERLEGRKMARFAVKDHNIELNNYGTKQRSGLFYCLLVSGRSHRTVRNKNLLPWHGCFKLSRHHYRSTAYMYIHKYRYIE